MFSRCPLPSLGKSQKTIQTQSQRSVKVMHQGLYRLTSQQQRGIAEFLEGPHDGKRTRPACLSDRADKQIHINDSHSLSPKDNFWTEIADEKSIEDAPKYYNNIEQYVGTVKVPVGLVGPLKVIIEKEEDKERVDPNSPHLQGKEYYLPFATTEGALLASYNRGAKAITRGGGARSSVIQRQMVRAPVFLFDNVIDASRFVYWFRNSGVLTSINEKILAQPHCHTTELTAIQTDRYVHIHIGIDSEDAAGQNMVTYCGRVLLEHVKATYKDLLGKGIQESYIEGGFNGGKRGSFLHLMSGKGLYTVVDAELPYSIVKEVLHTTPHELTEFQRMHQRTSTFIGTLSYTAHAANGLCAFYIANGQDPACTAESQAGVTNFEVRENPQSPGEPSLYASMTLPSLIVSTFGGGTHLPSQKACLDIVGLDHPRELACVLAAGILGGELSFYAAMVSQEFDAAHWNATHKK